MFATWVQLYGFWLSIAFVVQVNGMLLAGQKVYVGPFLKKSDRPVDRESHFTNVYVKNLPESVDDKKLDEIFSEHGTVTSAVVMKVHCFLLQQFLQLK